MAESGDRLSERELDVLRCLARGASNKDIASDLIISENTVKVHLRNIYTKLGVSSRTEATTAAMQQGYIAIPGQVETLPVDAAHSYDAGTAATMPVLATAVAGDVPTQAIQTENVPTSSKSRRTRMAIISIAVVLVLVTTAYLGQRFLSPESQATTGELFAETAIGNSHWLESRPMPNARANMAVAAVGLDLYQIGGETAAGVDGLVQVFDSLNRVWRTVAEKPTAVADASAAELYGEIYVAGGRMPDGQPTSAVEAYSPTQDAWRPVAPLPHPVSGGLTLSDGAFLYLIGGYDGDSYLDASFVYDPAEDSWRPARRPPCRSRDRDRRARATAPHHPPPSASDRRRPASLPARGTAGRSPGTGAEALRRERVRRLVYEALMQGGALSQEDIACILSIGRKTVQRIFAWYREQGQRLPSRGEVQDMGRGVSHKVPVIRRYIQDLSFTQISRELGNHGIDSMARYLRHFALVMVLEERGLTPEQMQSVIGISSNLVNEYRALYAELNVAEHQRTLQRLQQVVFAPATVEAPPEAAKKGGPG